MVQRGFRIVAQGITSDFERQYHYGECLRTGTHQNLENVLQQSVQQSIQRAHDHSIDYVFRQLMYCPQFDAFCDFAKSTDSKVPIHLLPSDHQSPR